MPGYHHVEEVMGMAVSIDVHDDVAGAPGLDELLGWLHHVDASFSPYREDSEITRLARGSLTADDAADEVIAVLRRCEEFRAETDGVFDVFAVPAPNGTTLDPSGYVKGWAIERAAGLLGDHGLANFCINAGGDVVVRGQPLPDPVWRVGVRDPDDQWGLAEVIECAGPLAVATSATYERGAHIVDPRTGEAVTDLASATVVGPDLGVTDAYATTLFVLGLDGLAWIDQREGYEALVIDHDGRLAATAGFTGRRIGALRLTPEHGVPSAGPVRIDQNDLDPPTP
jgi:thiamine biosynthesis lipoprotein